MSNRIRVSSVGDDLLININNKDVDFYAKERSRWGALDGKIVFYYYEDTSGDGVWLYKNKFAYVPRDFVTPEETSVQDLLLLLNDLTNEINEVNKADVIYSEYKTVLPNTETIDSGWLDMGDSDKVQFSGHASASGMTMIIDSRSSEDQPALSTPITYDDGSFYMFNVICRQRYMRFRWSNNTGSDVTNVSMEIKQSFGSSDKMSVFPVGVQPSNFSQAALVQAIMRGKDPQGLYEAVAVNEAGAMLQSDFGTEVARGLYPSYGIGVKYGRNSLINTSSTPEDVWNGAGEYTGFNCIVSEILETSSGDVLDAGALVSSGTITTESADLVVDTGATFISDGVAVGDVVLNDSSVLHGFIESVDSETQLTVYRMSDSTASHPVNLVGDSYRVATATSTGASVVKLTRLLDSSYEQFSEYVILNGTSWVSTTRSYLRHSSAKIIQSGTSGYNVGEITTRQKTTTANITMVMPATKGSTAIACSTVPKGKVWIIKRMLIQMTRNNGSDGSANCSFLTREIKGSWNAERSPEISSSQEFSEQDIGGIVLQEFTDIKWRVDSVSDNGTIVGAEFEYFEIDA